MLAAATQGQDQRMAQLLELAAELAASGGKDTGGEVRLGAEQGDGRQDGAGDLRRLRKRRCRRGIFGIFAASGWPVLTTKQSHLTF